MGRMARILSDTGMYHITFRGLNRQNIFEESFDFEKFRDFLRDVKKEKDFKLYAYCLMNNHVHLFLHEKELGDIIKIMHKLLTRYVGWYNLKYQRHGSLIGNRYKSEPIESEAHGMALIRYIHQNPLDAHLVENIKNYPWCSFNEYVNPCIEREILSDIDFFLAIFSVSKDKAIKLFIEYHNEKETEDFQIDQDYKSSDEMIRRRLINVLEGKDPKELSYLDKTERNQLLRYLHGEKKFTIAQLERLTGISRGIIYKANKQS